MDEPQEQKMTPFDQMISDDNLQLLKASIPYAPVKMQGFLSVLVKAKELETVLSLTRKKSSVQMKSQEIPDSSFTDMLSDIGRYTSGSMKEMFDGISQAMSMFEMFQNLQDMDMSNMDMSNMNFKDMFQGFSTGDSEENSSDKNSDENMKPPPVDDSDIKEQEKEVDDIMDSFIKPTKGEDSDSEPQKP